MPMEVRVVAWHPRHAPIVACAPVPNRSFEEAVAAACRSQTFTVLVFSLSASAPVAILESPVEPTCLAWCPSDHHLIAAGTASG